MLTTVTNTALLQALSDFENGTVWQDYLERYRPLIVGHARRAGLEEADAEDVAQQTLVAFATAYRKGDYDRARGRLRAWLFGIARTALRGFQRGRQIRRGREVQVTANADGEGTGFFARLPDDDRLEELWEEEWRHAVVRQCVEEIRGEVEEQTFRAFELFAHQGKPAREVSQALGITENAVFLAKRRVLARIRALLPQMEEVF